MSRNWFNGEILLHVIVKHLLCYFRAMQVEVWSAHGMSEDLRPKAGGGHEESGESQV